MTPEQKTELNNQGRTNVLGMIQDPVLPENMKRAAYQWISEDDRNRQREARIANIAAIVAAAAATVAAIAAIIAAMK